MHNGGMETFGERLRIIRKARCISQLTIEEKTRIPQNTLSQIENDRYFPPESSRRGKLADITGANLSWLEKRIGSPFSGREPIIYLNECKTKSSQDAAIHLALATYSNSTFLYHRSRCFVIQVGANFYVLIFLSPTAKKDVLEKLLRSQLTYIGDCNEGVPLEVPSLRDLFKSRLASEHNEKYEELLKTIKKRLIEEPDFLNKLRLFLHSTK